MKYPKSRALIVRKTRKSMSESVLVTLERDVILDTAIGTTKRNQRQSYPYANGSELVVGGMDDPSKIMSTDYHIIGVFEGTELNEDEIEKLTTRLGRDALMPFQQIIIDCNPSYPSHWLNLRCNANRTTRILSRHQDNPNIYNRDGTITELGKKYIDRISRSLTGARRARLLLGQWAAQEGLVYENYDAAIHLIDRFEIPKEWPRFRCLDWGYTNPFVCQWWAIDPDDRLYRYREIYHTKRLVEDLTREIIALSTGEEFTQTVADHDAEDRATMERHGIKTTLAIKDVSRGLQAVEARLRIADDGKPRIFFLRDSLVASDPSLADAKRPTCTEQEFDCYVWPKGADGKANKEAPVKNDDHGMDTLRYACMSADNPVPVMDIFI